MKHPDLQYWLLKYKSAHWTDEAIAKKLGISVQEVSRIWVQMQEQAQRSVANGSLDLSRQFTVMAYQYQLIGESLKILGGALGNEASLEEIEKLIDEDKKASAERIRSQLIVLRHFQFEDPEKVLQDHLARQAAGN